MELTDRQVSELTDGGECWLHHHPEDRRPNHDTLNQLQSLAAPKTVSGNYSVSYDDDHILVPAGYTITLPLAKANKEFEVTMTGVAPVRVYPSGTDTLVGATDILIEQQWTSLRFKGVSGGYILI